QRAACGTPRLRRRLLCGCEARSLVIIQPCMYRNLLRCTVGKRRPRRRGGEPVCKAVLVRSRSRGQREQGRRFVRRYGRRRHLRGSQRYRRFSGYQGGRRRVVFVDVADEAKSALVQSANEALVAAAVAERAPCRADAGVERRLRDDAALPDDVEQLVFADDPVAIANEVNEQVEHLRLDVDIRPGKPQLLPREVDLEIGEAEAQSSPHHLTESRSSPGGDLSNSWRLLARLNYTIRNESPRDRPINPHDPPPTAPRALKRRPS